MKSRNVFIVLISLMAVLILFPVSDQSFAIEPAGLRKADDTILLALEKKAEKQLTKIERQIGRCKKQLCKLDKKIKGMRRAK